MHDQVLPVRYIDKEKLGNFWRSHDDFKDKLCVIKAVCTAMQVDYDLAQRWS